MSMTAESAKKAVEMVKRMVSDKEDRAVRDHEETVRLEVDCQFAEAVEDVDGFIQETIENAEYTLTWEIDDNEVHQALRSRVGKHYEGLGYSTRYDKRTAEMGDSAAPCSVDLLQLHLGWG